MENSPKIKPKFYEKVPKYNGEIFYYLLYQFISLEPNATISFDLNIKKEKGNANNQLCNCEKYFKKRRNNV